ncbi:hypothetical protein N7516_000167 [Penicillium verrucosum]|uniref:uncharacterized protein n=1 Tax=Penicillium verrucosum TaxID=60171 RepID=UPI00254516F7|nr:uncharacterized protein N7516_000167 [Penicillium verrucosum]KAJ5939999.1 hypothetical protein N7516_000167 [Penicillium verrucosum]
MASLNTIDNMKEHRDSLSSDNDGYQPLDTTESPPLLGNGSHSLRTRRRRKFAIPTHWPWILSTSGFTLISFCLLAMDWASAPPRGTYESGFSTDLDAAFPAIQINKVRFTGGLYYDANGTVVRNRLSDGGPEWVGPPNPATDRLWDDITESMFFNISLNEI